MAVKHPKITKGAKGGKPSGSKMPKGKKTC